MSSGPRRSAVGASAAALLASSALPGTGLAQVPQADTAAVVDTVARPASDGPARLPQVVVTALRLPTEIRRAPYAVARNDADMTRRARPGLAFGEPLHGLPGVQVDNRHNFALGERITVRGFGARTQFGVRGVRVVVDGIPATMPDGQSALDYLDLGMIGSVEVVRTPIAALYGNAAGGVIAVQTLPPPAGQLVSASRLAVGSHGLVRKQTGVGGTLENTGYLLNVGRLSYDGYREHNSADNRYLTARTSSDFGQITIGLTAHHVRYEALNPGALPDSMVRTDRAAAFPSNLAQRTGKRGEHSQASVTVDAPLGAQRLTVVTHGLRRTIENPIIPQIIDLTRRASGARISLSSGTLTTNRLRWDAGVEGAVQNDDRFNYRNVAGVRDALTLEQDERVRSAAAFAAAQLRLLQQLELQAGFRRDAVMFEVEDHLITETNPDDSGERTMRAWSPSLGASLQVGRDVYLFTNVGTAFDTPTTTELANRPTGAGGFNAELEPQRTLSYEIGTNGVGRWMFYQAALFRARISDALVPFEVPGTPGRQFFRNAGSAVHRGAEVMLGWSAGPAVSGRVTYSHTDARYRVYTVGETSHAGNRVPGVAPHRVDALLRLSNQRGFADVETRYQSRVPVNDGNTAWSSAYAIHGVRLGLADGADRRFRVSPYFGVDNVFGRVYNSSVTVNAAGGRYYEPGPGRTFYLGTDLRFEAIRALRGQR